MDKFSEIWVDAFSGRVPKQDYTVKLEHGESGLRVTLDGNTYRVFLNFGSVDAMQMLEEGVDLNPPEGYELSPSFWAQHQGHFASTIYRIKNGSFSRRMRTIMGEVLFDAVERREYHIVTLNYSISILSQWEPEITVTPNG